MDATRRRWRRAAALAAVVSLAGAAQASAAITVTTTADTIDDADPGACLSGGACTLRQAIFAARGADQTIVLPAGTYVLSFGELAIQQDAGTLTIRGAGAGSTTIDQQSFPHARVLRVGRDDGAAALTGLTITHGELRGEDGAAGADGERGGPGDDAVGGGILNEGDLTLTDVVVTDNAVTGGRGGSGGAAADAQSAPGAGGSGGMGTGGGISNQGTLLLRRTSVVANHAAGGEGGGAGAGATALSGGRGGAALGAGVHNDGALTLADATVSANVGTGGDGGPGNLPGATGGEGGEAAGGGLSDLGSSLAIAASTISDNAAIGGQGGVAGGGYGGGLVLFRAFALTRSTLVGNTAATGQTEPGPNQPGAVGGGIYATAGGTVDATTLLANRTSISLTSDPTEGVGGSIAADDAGPAVTLRSSLLAYGDGAPGTRNCVGNVTSAGGNVATTDASECGFAAGDTAGADLDALPDLADNGGPTETVALPAGSPALGAGDCAAAATDQRGAPRNGICDAGAFQRVVQQAELLPESDINTDRATLNARLTGTWGATYRFSYGVSDPGEHDLGEHAVADTGATPIAISQPVANLRQGVYRFRLVVVGRGGSTTVEGTFATAIKGPPPPIPGDDGGPGRQLPPTPTATPPTLTKLSATARSFQVRKARGRGRKRRVSGGTTVRFTLSAAATVGARVERLPARRGGRARAVGTLALGARRAGVNSVAVSGRVGRRTLAPGRYRLTLTAKAGALTSRAVTLVLVVRRG